MIGYLCLDQTSTGPRPGKEGYWEREKLFGLPQPVLDQMSTIGRLVPQPVESVGHKTDRLSLLALKTYFFNSFLF